MGGDINNPEPGLSPGLAPSLGHQCNGPVSWLRHIQFMLYWYEREMLPPSRNNRTQKEIMQNHIWSTYKFRGRNGPTRIYPLCSIPLEHYYFK